MFSDDFTSMSSCNISCQTHRIYVSFLQNVKVRTQNYDEELCIVYMSMLSLFARILKKKPVC